MGTWASRFLLRCGGKSESCGMNRCLCPVLGFVYLGDEASRRLFLCCFRRILSRQPCSEADFDSRAIRSAGCPALTCRRTRASPVWIVIHSRKMLAAYSGDGQGTAPPFHMATFSIIPTWAGPKGWNLQRQRVPDVGSWQAAQHMFWKRGKRVTNPAAQVHGTCLDF